jgi:hypothetical protein
VTGIGEPLKGVFWRRGASSVLVGGCDRSALKKEWSWKKVVGISFISQWQIWLSDNSRFIEL